MKTLSMLFVLAALSFTAIACDDDSSNNGNNNSGDFCEQVCAKDFECDPEMDEQECVAECGGMAPLMLSSFLNGIADCYDSHTCEEMESMEPSCSELAAATCNTNVEDMTAAMCEKEYECGGITPTVDQINECVEAMQDSGDFMIFACYQSSAINGYTSCIEDVTCETKDADMEACAEEHLGMEAEEDLE